MIKLIYISTEEHMLIINLKSMFMVPSNNFFRACCHRMFGLYISADGYVRCDLCDSLGSKDKQRDTMPTSLLNAKEMLFRKPNISMR